MTITVRSAVVADAAAILELNAAFADVRATVEHIKAHIETGNTDETPFVAEVDGRVVGLACLRVLSNLCDPTPYAELSELIVHPGYRRRGVGRDLVRKIEAQARVQGADRLVLMTAWRNSEAHAFYYALGYRLYTVTMARQLVDRD